MDAAIYENVMRQLAMYIDISPRAITKEMMDEALNAYDNREAIEERAYSTMLCMLIGIDPENSIAERQLANEIITPSIHKLDANDFKQNDYYKNIHINPLRIGEFELCYDEYAPYELFVAGDMHIDAEGKRLASFGFFDEEFRFPAIHENGREWMSIKPNEILTMNRPVERAHGKVLTLGLGMGYYTYMASQKTNVESVTVVDCSNDAINIFNSEILPQIPNRQKINIINSDAVEYFAQHANDYDYIFADLWHDAIDGSPIYKKLKKAEPQGIEIDYWVENQLTL